jgi:hypothetical protein
MLVEAPDSTLHGTDGKQFPLVERPDHPKRTESIGPPRAPYR